MKIAMVVTGGLHPSGREQVVPSWLALFEALAKTHEIHAFVLRHLPDARTYSLSGFTVHDLGRPSAPGLTRWAQQRALMRAVSDAGPFDLVHGYWGDPAGLLAARAGRRLNIPSIVTCDSGEFVSLRDIDYGSQRTARGRRAVAEACALATRVHVCSSFMAEQAARHGVQATVIPLTSVKDRGREERIRAASRIPDPGSRGESPLRMLQVASLSRVKNQRLLIDALPILSERADAHVDLVGEDTLGGELQRYAGQRGLADRVTCHGFVSQDRLPAFYAAAGLYVQTSLHEAAGVSVLEAAAAGVPIVGTRAGYVADWAADRAMAIDSPDPESLGRAILAMQADQEHARAMAAKARSWSLARDAGWAAARFDELYRNAS